MVLVRSWDWGDGEGEWSGECVFLLPEGLIGSDINRFSSVSGGLFVKATGALGLRSETE